MTETDVQPDVETYRARAGALGAMLTAAPYRHNQYTWGGVKQENECGTAACAAGWSLLAKRGIVTIARDGAMTFDTTQLGSMYDRDEFDSDEAYQRAAKREHTLWRDEFYSEAEDEGADWLGLSFAAAKVLFVHTTNVTHSNEVARELLLRIGDGRLGELDEDGRIHFWLDAENLEEIAAQFDKD
jgi:hypothetical protein